MGGKTCMQQSTCNQKQSRVGHSLPCSMFQPNKTYLGFVNQTRTIQNLAKSESQKGENVPHRIDFKTTRAYETNKTSHGSDKVVTIN